METRTELLSFHLSCEETEAGIINLTLSFRVTHMLQVLILKEGAAIHNIRNTSSYVISKD